MKASDTDRNSNSHEKTDGSNKGDHTWVITKDSMMAYFFSVLFLSELKSNCIKQYVYDCIVGPIMYKNVTYLTITAQRKQLGEEMVPNDGLESTGRNEEDQEMYINRLTW